MPYTQSVLTAARTIETRRAEMPDAVEPGWARLRLATASLCGTDMHYYRHFANAGFALNRPTTLGHEACAFVEEGNGMADAHGAALAKGTLVAINPVIACGECERCGTGDINMCATKRFPGSATTVPHIDGFFRERFDFPARCLRVVGDVEPDHLTFAEPLACAMHSIERAGVEAGMKVLVTGCGPMGLLAAVAARAKGAEVHASDLREDALGVAEAAGASRTFMSGRDAMGTDYDVVVEASGSPHGFNAALDAARKQGTLSILSLIQPSEVPTNLHLIALKELRIVGSILFTHEFDRAVDLIASGTVDFGALVAGRYPVSRTGEACERMASGRAAGKVLVTPEA